MSDIKETVLGNLQSMLPLLRKLVWGIETTSSVHRLSKNTVLDLGSKGIDNVRGVRHFTCRNLGKSIIYISTGEVDEKEPVNPDETFAINSPFRVCDKSVKISFGAVHPDFAAEATRSNNDVIVRYLVDKC